MCVMATGSVVSLAVYRHRKAALKRVEQALAAARSADRHPSNRGARRAREAAAQPEPVPQYPE